MDIALLAALILLNGLFAMTEIALVTARKSRLRTRAGDGDRAAAAALRLSEEPTRFLSTIQIGITAIGLLNGIIGEAALAGPLAGVLTRAGIPPRPAGIAATAAVVAGITMFSIVLGELVPKRLAQLNAEGIARIMARPIALLAQFARPFVFLLSAATDGILRLAGKDTAEARVTEEDIEAMLADGSQAGVIEKQEHEMVRNVFRLDDRPIASLMTPRAEMVFLDAGEPVQDVLDRFIASNHSRFPVCRGSTRNVIGFISAKRLLRRVVSGETGPLEADLQPAVFVPETLTGMKLLQEFKQSGVRMVFVVDEYGDVLGLITLQNVLEALAGEFTPADPEDAWSVHRPDGSWLLDGLIPVPELRNRLELRTIPDGDKAQYNTLGGMLLRLAGRIPGEGETVCWGGWQFRVAGLDGRRIDKVTAERLSGEAGENTADEAAGETS